MKPFEKEVQKEEKRKLLRLADGSSGLANFYDSLYKPSDIMLR